ncbi:MAG: hypothetical protein Q8M08_02975 [Bacteroidales bacterium]|nr:hypothetical protein [Bacteroidales bacterium]
MSKNTTTLKPTNGKAKVNEVVADATVVSAEKIIAEVAAEAEVVKPILDIKPEVASQVIPEVIRVAPVVKEMTMIEKILKVENLSLVIEKRAKLVQTRSELDRFQTSSNDFNCSMRLNDSDGNVFTTSFTPGVKKVVEFLRQAFDESIEDVEKKITF